MKRTSTSSQMDQVGASGIYLFPRQGRMLQRLGILAGILAMSPLGHGWEHTLLAASDMDVQTYSQTAIQADAALPPLLGAAAAATAPLGISVSGDGQHLDLSVWSSKATRMEAWFYPEALGEAAAVRVLLSKDASTNRFSAHIPLETLEGLYGVSAPYFYGLRAWGPNWVYRDSWLPGASDGFLLDVDSEGNRFNPNKLLLDPYSLEVSHDPQTPEMVDAALYATGPTYRNLDSGLWAPKSLLIEPDAVSTGTKPTRAFKDEIVYEVHVRGLTMNDASVPAACRGTYAGAAAKAASLKALGVTAVEFLPLHETQNDLNDAVASSTGDNYWGYMTLSYFAPDRRYACDQSPGGPTREFKQLVKAYHDQGLKVYVDVVYNHTLEGGVWDATGQISSLISWRGLDNAAYYELASDPRMFYDNTGCGANFNAGHSEVRSHIMTSLQYWTRELGVDGFRFDLASVLGNTMTRAGFRFDKMDAASVLNRAVKELPARSASGGAGVDLIAEPWALGSGTYQVGNFPTGWAEWNDKFRDSFRKDQNRLGSEVVTIGELATRFAGSSDLFQDDGRKPWHSTNFIVAHDGFTLKDLYSYNNKNNNQAWPYGPSEGGSDNNLSWDQGGDPAAQRQAARNGMAMIMLSAGVPMMTGGDEFLRSIKGNNNPYNLDSSANWLNYADASTNARFYGFSKKLLAFRSAHTALRRAEFFSGQDKNGNGLKDITWLSDAGNEPAGWYWSDPSMHFLAFRLDGTEVGDVNASIYVGYNGWSGPVTATLPNNLSGKKWYRVSDTSAWMESQDNFKAPGSEDLLTSKYYTLNGRSLLLLIEK